MSESSTKPCSYPGCANTILDTNEFGMCEVCRALSVRNALTITLDPTSPISDRRDMVFSTMIHNMRPDEILNAVHKIEWAYLELQKTLKSHEIELYRRQKFAEATILTDVIRTKASKTPKTEAKKESRKDKLKKLLGSEDAVKSIMGEDFSDL